MYKAVMKYPDGTTDDDDEVVDSESAATDRALDAVSWYSLGGEILNMSNPGDYPLSEDDEPDFEVVEV